MENYTLKVVGVANAATEVEADATTPQPRRQQLARRRVAFHHLPLLDRATIRPIATSGTTT